MRTFMVVAAASLAAVLATVSAFGGKGEKGFMPRGWYGDYDEAQTIAKQTGKPLFVVFR